jgi:hypothetical protein
MDSSLGDPPAREGEPGRVCPVSAGSSARSLRIQARTTFGIGTDIFKYGNWSRICHRFAPALLTQWFHECSTSLRKVTNSKYRSN